MEGSDTTPSDSTLEMNQQLESPLDGTAHHGSHACNRFPGASTSQAELEAGPPTTTLATGWAQPVALNYQQQLQLMHQPQHPDQQGQEQHQLMMPPEMAAALYYHQHMQQHQQVQLAGKRKARSGPRSSSSPFIGVSQVSW